MFLQTLILFFSYLKVLFLCLDLYIFCSHKLICLPDYQKHKSLFLDFSLFSAQNYQIDYNLILKLLSVVRIVFFDYSFIDLRF